MDDCVVYGGESTGVLRRQADQEYMVRWRPDAVWLPRCCSSVHDPDAGCELPALGGGAECVAHQPSMFESLITIFQQCSS